MNKLSGSGMRFTSKSYFIDAITSIAKVFQAKGFDF